PGASPSRLPCLDCCTVAGDLPRYPSCPNRSSPRRSVHAHFSLLVLGNGTRITSPGAGLACLCGHPSRKEGKKMGVGTGDHEGLRALSYRKPCFGDARSYDALHVGATSHARASSA